MSNEQPSGNPASGAETGTSASSGKSASSGNNSGNKRRAGALVWLALLLALASIGLSSYPFWSQWTGDQTAAEAQPSNADFASLVDRVENRVERLGQESMAAIEEVRADLTALAAGSGQPDPGLEALSGRVDQLGSRLETLQGQQNGALSGVRTRIGDLESRIGGRLEQFERRLSDLGGQLDNAGNADNTDTDAGRDLAARLLLLETDSLFAMAQNYLAVSGEPGSALLAWARGLDRLAALNGAEFDNLRAVAQSEYDALKNFSPPGIGPRVERLYRMSDEVSDWPVRAAQSGPEAISEAGEGGWRDRVGSVLGKLVQVEAADSEFLRPADVELARERVRTILHSSALALVRGRPELADQLVEEAAAVTRRIFDSESAAVAGALAWLDDFSAADDEFAPPSLTATRLEISRLLGEIR